MDRRSIVFIFSLSLILMGLLLMTQKKPEIDAGNGNGNDQNVEQPAEGDDSNQSNDENQTEENASDQDGDEQAENETPEQPEIQPPPPEQFFTLGSLSPDSSDWMLATFTNHGGAIKKVEYNFRKKRKNKLAYRDIEFKGGYLGDLQLSRDVATTDEGEESVLNVRSVGAGTPAQIAGIQVGDQILQLGDIPVLSIDAFYDQLRDRHKPGDDVAVKVWREGQKVDINVSLTEKPIEIIRPEPDTFESGMPSPESFLMTLRQPDGLDWQEIDPGMMSSTWESTETQIDGNPAIEFSYTISNEKLAKVEMAGPIKVTRTYWLTPVPEEERYDISKKHSHIKTRIAIENLSNQTQQIGYQLNGATGTPTEGWWYIIKIHGRSTAVGYMAGSRDVASSNAKQDYVFFGGPEIVKNVEATNPKLQWLSQNDNPDKQLLNYLSVDTQYFNVSLLPSESETNSEWPYSCESAIAALSGSRVPTKNAKLARLADCTFLMFDKIELEAGKTYSQDFDIFAGPKHPNLLQTYGLEDNRTFGWFAIFSKPLCWLLKIFYMLTGSISYGLAIIMLTVLVRSLMIPISRKAAINAQMMQALQPKMKEIADKYKDNMEKRAQAQRDLFRRHNYNPFGGCLLMFFQLPIFIGLYRGLSVDIALRDQALIPGMQWCSNLAAPDQLFYWGNWMPSFLGSETGFLGPYFNLLPMFTIVLFLMQQRLFTPPATDDQQRMMQKMMTFMMFFMGILFFKVPAALCLYFITSSIWGIVERKMLPKPQLSEEKLSELKGTTVDVDSSDNDDDKSGSAKGQSLFERFKEAVDQNATGRSKKQEFDLSAEEKKRIDRERKKRLRKKGS